MHVPTRWTDHFRGAWAGVPPMALAVVIAVTGWGLVSGPSPAAAAPAPRPYYLSLGDSYAIGYQPGRGATAGFTGYVAHHLALHQENFGCGGATTTSLLQSPGCVDPATQDAAPYTGITQEQAALAFIAAHPKAVRLVTISIGGNDFDSCSSAPCVEAAMPTMGANPEVPPGLADDGPGPGRGHPCHHHRDHLSRCGPRALRVPHPPGVGGQSGSGQDLHPGLRRPDQPDAAERLPFGSRSQLRRRHLGALQGATRGDDTPLTRTEIVPPYGRLPVAVGEVCQSTYFCTQGNIHAHTSGYDFIGSLVVADFHKA